MGSIEWLEWLVNHDTIGPKTEALIRLVYTMVPIAPQVGSINTFAHWLKDIKASKILTPDELDTLRYEINECLW